MTAPAPAKPSSSARVSNKSPLIVRTSALPGGGVIERRLTSALTPYPRANSSSMTAEPTKPLAPVKKIRPGMREFSFVARRILVHGRADHFAHAGADRVLSPRGLPGAAAIDDGGRGALAARGLRSPLRAARGARGGEPVRSRRLG